MIKLTIKTLTPSVGDNMTIINSNAILQVKNSPTKFKFSQINSIGEEVEYPEYVLKSTFGSWKYWDFPPKYTFLPEKIPYRLSFHLLSLLSPTSKVVEFNLLDINLYDLLVLGETQNDLFQSLLFAIKPHTTFSMTVENFDHNICKKINRIAQIQLNQLKQLSLLLNFEQNDRFASSIEYLYENIPSPKEGCLIHWTYNEFIETIQSVINFTPIIISSRKLTRDMGFELMPFNWAIVEPKEISL